jgi:hypothetical protein
VSIGVSTRRAGNPEKRVQLEAGTADQRAVYFLFAK